MYFDIGSNIGLWSLANINTCNSIISIEASPITYRKLIENCKHDNIILLNYAVCNNDGKDITFYNSNIDTLSTLNKDWLTHEKSRFVNTPYEEITCKTISIDTLIQQYGIPDLIKIDVEGGEFECISSLTKKANLIAFEWASELNDITFKCIDHLFQLGYREYYIQKGDEYTYRPPNGQWNDISILKTILYNTRPKIDFGMIWCK